jgi:hypothetical protein
MSGFGIFCGGGCVAPDPSEKNRTVGIVGMTDLRNPESLDDPKQMLMRLIRRYGYRKIKVDVLLDRGSPAKIGLGYNRILSQFVRENWSPVRAAKNADSLARTCLRLHELGGKVSHESQ